MAVAAQQHREIVEPGDDSLKLDALHEEHRHRRLRLAKRVEEEILERAVFVGHLAVLIGMVMALRRAGYRCEDARLDRRAGSILGMRRRLAEHTSRLL